MESAIKSNPLPRAISLVLVTLFVAWLFQIADAHSLKRMDSMLPAAYIDYRHGVLGHSYLFRFGTLLILGGFYLGTVEVITSLVRTLTPKARGD
jgi:hypothetical protein